MKKVLVVFSMTLIVLLGCGKEKAPQVASEVHSQSEKEEVKAPVKKKALPVSNIADLGERQEACLIPFNGKVYYTGGYNNTGPEVKRNNDLWVTEDFINWEKILEPAFEPYGSSIRYEKEGESVIIFPIGNWNVGDTFIAVQKNGEVIIKNYPEYKDVIHKNPSQYYFDNYDERLYYHPYLRWIDNELYLLDCYYGLFQSVDGKFENIYSAEDSFKYRLAANYQEHNERLFLIAGGTSKRPNLNFDGFCNDVWVTEDILKPEAWKQIGKIRSSIIAYYGEKETKDLGTARHDIYDTFPAREYAVTVSFKGKIYIMGGRRKMVDLSDGKEKYYWYQDVWCSEDGINWEQIVGPEYDEDFVPPGWKLIELYGD